MRRGEIGYAFILGNLRIQNPCLDGVWSVVADGGWEHEVASVTLLAGKGECLLALDGLDDGCCIVLRFELALEVNIQRTAVLDVRHSIALVVVVSADIYHQSLTVFVGYCLTYDVALGIESLFCRLLFPVIITEIGEGKLFFACTNFQFSFRKIQSRIVFIYLMPASIVESLGGEGMLACLAELRMSHHQLGTWLQGDGIFASHAHSEGGALKERELAGKESYRSNFMLPATIRDNAPYTIEAWILNPEIAENECVADFTSSHDELEKLMLVNGTEPRCGVMNHYGWYEDAGYKEMKTLEGKWQHVYVCFDGRIESIYINAKLISQKDIQLLVKPSQFMLLGKNAEEAWPFSGYLHSLKLWDEYIPYKKTNKIN